MNNKKMYKVENSLNITITMHCKHTIHPYILKNNKNNVLIIKLKKLQEYNHTIENLFKVLQIRQLITSIILCRSFQANQLQIIQTFQFNQFLGTQSILKRNFQFFCQKKEKHNQYFILNLAIFQKIQPITLINKKELEKKYENSKKQKNNISKFDILCNIQLKIIFQKFENAPSLENYRTTLQQNTSFQNDFQLIKIQTYLQ
eukprot:TRINITY_DN25255_c0_g1_i3.p2 TRINITY_DN25255_c0_g1~~TRINITY_DN25255_c0_g1_i3.p2  ORF type:complete len:202 (+),score=-20.04 TRINITY_DN25255_c0_g1_i3:360-965(+)